MLASITRPSATAIPSRAWLWFALALLPYAVVVATRWNEPPAATDGDYAQYLLHAKALAEGRPYSDIGYIYSARNFVGPRNQPPGWPIVLAPIVGAFGVHTPLIKLLVVTLVGGFALAAGVYITRFAGLLAGAAVCMAVPLALETSHATASALSDPLGCLLIWLALLLADRRGQGRWLGRWATAIPAFAAGVVRVAGVAILPALVAHAFVRRQPTLRRVLTLIAIGAGGFTVLAVAGSSIPFLGNFLPGRGLLRFAPAAFTETYRNALSIGALFPFVSDQANDVYQILIGIPLLVGAIRFGLGWYQSALWWFALTYVGLLLVSPLREPRYAWPLIPLVMFWSATGLSQILHRLPVSVRFVQRFVGVLIAAIGIGAATQLVRTPPRPSLVGDPATRQVFDVVRATADTAQNAPRVVFTNPRVLTLETGVPAMGFPFGMESQLVEEFAAERITHVIVQRPSPSQDREVSPLASLVARPELFTLVYQNEGYSIYRFGGTAGLGTPP